MAERPLTKNEEAFCQAVLTERYFYQAYDKAYPPGADGRLRTTSYVEACMLLKKPKIARRIDELRKLATGVTFDSHLEELETLKGEARKAGVWGAAVQAEQLKGKVAGLYIDRIQTEPGTKLTDEQLAASISEPGTALYEVVLKACKGERMDPTRIIAIASRYVDGAGLKTA